MPTLSQLNFGSSFVILFITSSGAFLVSLGYTIYYYLYKRHQPKRSKHDPRDIAIHEAVKIVDAARSKAMEMLGEAHNEAKTILHDSEDINTTVKETFDQRMQEIGQRQMQSFDQMSNELLDSYKAVLAQERDTSLRSITDISSKLKEELTGEMHGFKQNIQQITSETTNNLKTGLKAQYDEVSGEFVSLKENLQRVTQLAEQDVRDNIGGQFDVVKNEISAFANNIKRISDETSSNLQNELSNEYGQAKDVIHNLSEDLKRIVNETEEELKQGVKAEYDQVREELANYKKDRYEKIDGVVRGMLEEVARDVLGKTMNAHDHEELIIRSLESIKRTTNLKEL